MPTTELTKLRAQLTNMDTFLEFVKLLTARIYARCLAYPNRKAQQYGPTVDRHIDPH
jgi:hypothetical protein